MDQRSNGKLVTNNNNNCSYFVNCFRTNILATGLNVFGAKQGAKILILGAPSPEFRAILTDQENKDIIKEARFMTLDSISHNPEERIKIMI